MSDIGPKLPPGFARDAKQDASERKQIKQPEQHSHDTAKGEKHNQQGRQVGPELPPGLKTRQSSNNGDTDTSSVIGPQVPAPASETREQDAEESIVGPSLPPHLLAKRRAQRAATTVQGPPAKPQEIHDDEDDDDIIGPLPAEAAGPNESALSSHVYEIEERARAMKRKLEGADEDEAPKRESWMLTPPSQLKQSFAGPSMKSRSFRQTSAPSTAQAKASRDAWTATPKGGQPSPDTDADKQPAPKERDPAFMSALAEQRSEEIRQTVQKYNEQHRSMSLMDMHKQKRRKQFREGTLPDSKKGFDRERDMKATGFSYEEKQRVLSSVSKLGSRFSSGKY